MDKKIRKYDFSDFARSVFDDMAVGLDYLSPTIVSTTRRGTWVDTDKYDIVPRKSYYEELITQTQQKIEALDRQHESDQRYYENRRKDLVEKKERLLRERDNRSD